MVNEQTTSSDGTCTLNGVSGEITITVTKEGYQDTETTLTVTEDTTVTIELEEVDDMDLTDNTRNVKFNVEDGEGEKVSGASITLVDKEDSTHTINSSNGGTGLRGGATLRDVEYGTYDVTVSKESDEVTFELTVDETLSVNGDSATVNATSSSETVLVTLS